MVVLQGQSWSGRSIDSAGARTDPVISTSLGAHDQPEIELLALRQIPRAERLVSR
jgi:hypothetical protein